MMHTANVVSAGRAEHPESGVDLMRIIVDREWAVAGERWPMTELWAELAAPLPATGEPVQWGDRHIWIRGVRYRKPEDDRNPGASFH